MNISNYIATFNTLFAKHEKHPWEFVQMISEIVKKRLLEIPGNDYLLKDDIAIHKTVIIEQGVIIKGPAIISANCFVGAHAYLRGGVWLDEKVSVGPGCEVKATAIFSGSALAHFNFVGDSIVGSGVNMEAGSVVANHYNERADKRIYVRDGHQIIDTGATKFGALIGDHTRIGANAVLSPGTILPPNSIVKRLELIDQFQ